MKETRVYGGQGTSPLAPFCPRVSARDAAAEASPCAARGEQERLPILPEIRIHTRDGRSRQRPYARAKGQRRRLPILPESEVGRILTVADSAGI